MDEIGRRLTPFESRIATAIRSASVLEQALRRQHIPGFVVTIHMGEEAYAEAQYLLRKGSVYASALQAMFGFPVVADPVLLDDQITVQASTVIA